MLTTAMKRKYIYAPFKAQHFIKDITVRTMRLLGAEKATYFFRVISRGDISLAR